MTSLGNGAHRSGSRPVRLLALGLTDRDLAKLEVFLHLARGSLRFEWQLVLEGPFDVQMLAEEAPAAGSARGAIPAAILEIAGPPAMSLPSRRRVPIQPLQYEGLIEALAPLEQLMAAPCDRAALAQSDVPQLPSSPPDFATGFLAPRQEMASSFRESPSPEMARFPGATYRLRRWPAADLLLEHRYHVRLASCLSPRHVGLAELARLTNVEADLCDAFLGKLMEAGLLEVRSPGSNPETMPHGSEAPAFARQRSPRRAGRLPDPGLFEKLRRRLLGSAR